MQKLNLQQRLLQRLSPQQIQMIKLLELPTMQLEQRIKEELEVNPVLEEGGDQVRDEAEMAAKTQEDTLSNIDSYINDDDTPSYKLYANNYSKDTSKGAIPFSVGTDFHTSLEDQLGLRPITPRQLGLGQYLIGSIDDDGYLRRPLENIVDDIAFALNLEVTEAELEEVLRVIQDFEPLGVGARNLQECLLIQIRHKDQQLRSVVLATAILEKYFEEFTKKHYDKIASKLDISEEELKDAIEEIITLTPKPGSSYNDPHSVYAEHIVPDFVLELKDGELLLSLNSMNQPELRISREYQTMLKEYVARKADNSKQDKEAVTFVKQKIDSAKWFIDALKLRQNTLMLTMNAILEFQREYFMEGDDTKLRPMILKDIAAVTELDISTISRVVNSKYIQTHFGIYPLKHFFSEGMQTDSGEEVSTREIKKILEECIASENKKHPLTDEALMDILKEKGYPIARRTVAKYREQLNIPVARLRKEL